LRSIHGRTTENAATVKTEKEKKGLLDLALLERSAITGYATAVISRQ
jgi:hypothetical protein